MKKNIRNVIFYVLLIVGVIVICAFLFRQPQTENVTYDDIYMYFINEEVDKYNLDSDNILTLELKNGETVKYELANVSIFYNDLSDTIKSQIEEGILTEVEYIPAKQISAWLAYLPLILMIVFVIVMYVIMAKQMSGGGAGKINSFGKARTKVANVNDKSRVTFKT